MRLIRIIGDILAALPFAFIGVVGVEMVSSIVHPFHADSDLTDIETCKQCFGHQGPVVNVTGC